MDEREFMKKGRKTPYVKWSEGMSREGVVLWTKVVKQLEFGTKNPKLTLLVPIVATAAQLCGIDVDVDDDATLIPLVVDTTGLHRRRLWECFLTKDGDGRVGKWGALAALGATIRALPNLAEHQAYTEPKPLEHRKVQVERGVYRTEVIDPEDESYTPPAIDPRRRSGRVTAV
jgi:hypothetical protein